MVAEEFRKIRRSAELDGSFLQNVPFFIYADSQKSRFPGCGPGSEHRCEHCGGLCPCGAHVTLL